MVTDKEFKKLKDDVDEIKKVLKEIMPILRGMQAQPTEVKDNQNISFGNFVKQKNPKTHEERALMIAYYVWQTEKRNFVYDDIVNFCKKVAWPLYSNPTMLIKELKNKDFIEEAEKKAEGKTEYRILEDGINFVENNFKNVKN